ncbi:MAG: hypothetical protein L3J88_01580 [Gammaproteobacteria bacterium]|nr:hypothetical protein [Gammaproteobacteria bacterium]MCF6362056.1 hypothetical protein [Gammaproteobacteria bacterium]
MGSFAKMKIIRELFFSRSLAPIIFLGLLSIVVSGCGGNNNNKDGDVTPQGQVTVAGVVSGSGGLVDVKVSSGSKSATTDANGFYELSNIPVPASGSIVLTYEKDGYATFQRSLPVADGETYAVAASLLQYHHNESIDAAQSNNLIIADPDNVTGPSLAEISFPAGSLASSGNVTVEVAVGDPTTEAGRPTFPGDYMAASTLGGEVDTPLESVVFTEITVTDANGTELTQLSEPATVTVRLPDTLQSQYSTGDTVPWWSYDETTATWVREDAEPATPQMDDAQVIDPNNDGVLYARAKVTHFSWWNVDVPMDEHACLCVTVQDENNAPAAGSLLIAEGVTYNGRSSPARTDMNGRACVTVKRSTTAVAERVKLYAESGSVKFIYDVTSALEGNVGSNEIFTPTTQGSTIRNTGQCVDLANTIEQRLDGIIKGTVTQEGSGSPIVDFTIFSDFGPTVITNAAGQYSINVPLEVPVSLFAVGLLSQSVTVADANTPVIVDFVVPNRIPVITEFTRMPNGIVTSGQTVTLGVTATDPDGNALTYAWDTTAGNLNQTAGISVVWTAPATGSGTAQTTVTITNANGGQTSQTASLVYSEEAQVGSRLSFVIKDNLSSDQPVQDITVALYNTDNRTIAQTRISNADGVVDFGDIGRDRATITVVYEEVFEGIRNVDTFIDVLVAENIVYYLVDDADPSPSNGHTPVNIDLSNVPDNTASISLEPMGDLLPYSTAINSLLDNFPVNPAYLQDDGLLSMLILAYSDASLSSPPNLVGYGFLLDQTVEDGASYDISLTRSPLNLGWITSPTTLNVNALFIFGERGGQRYTLSNILSPVVGGLAGAASGVMPIANEFPVESYWVLAGSGTMESTGLLSHVRYNTLPQSIVVTMPDVSIDNFDYAEATRTLNWGITGSAPHDSVSLTLTTGEDFSQWTVLMSEDTSSWQVMDLPAPASNWFDTANIMPGAEEIFVNVCDLDTVDGMDQLWQLFISGGSTSDASQYNCGVRGLAGVGVGVVGIASVALKAKARKPLQEGFDLPIKSLGHLRRR